MRIDNVFVSGAGSHAVETCGVDGITIGTVTARSVGENAGTGTGYAAFRMANRNGAAERRPPGRQAISVRTVDVAAERTYVARGARHTTYAIHETSYTRYEKPVA